MLFKYTNNPKKSKADDEMICIKELLYQNLTDFEIY